MSINRTYGKKPKPEKVTAFDLEMAAANHFDFRKNLIVPNVSWGMPGLDYEADLVVLRKSGYAAEVEIKVTASDIIADTKKQHTHDSKLFCELWFAVPEALKDHPAIPERAGILSFNNGRIWPVAHRQAERVPDIAKWTDEQRLALLRLGVMRVWGAKKKIEKLKAVKS